MLLSGKQRSYLKSLAHKMTPILHVGKNGITESLILQCEETLECKEMLKGKVLNNSLLGVREACEILAQKTKSEVVLVMGNKFVLYRESKDNKEINLP